MLKYIFSGSGDYNDSFFSRGMGRVDKFEDGQVTVLGWLGWLWSTCYAPTTQILWLVKNWCHPSGGLMIARGIGVAVSALSLTMDVKGRYGEALAELLGSWAHLAVSFFSTCSLLVLGVLSATELILGIIRGAVGTSYWAMVIYVLVLLFWTYGGFNFVSPTDKALRQGGGEGASVDLRWGSLAAFS